MSGSAPETEWAPGYTAAALLRQGRRARIIRATRVTSGAEVVLKVLPPDAGRAEVGHLQSLDGVPGAVPLLDAGTTSDGAFFIVLPFYPDGSFGEMLAKKGPAPLQEAAAVSRSVAAALGALHGRSLGHNDVCPGNVLRAGRTPVLTGFGAVHRAGEALPPPPLSMESFLHAPPEALQGEPRTPASDVYQLASTIWTMLVGHAPFAATDGNPFDPHQYANRVLHETPPPIGRSDISRSLRRVLTRALSKNPGDRYTTPTDFATAFERARTGRVATSPQTHGGQPAEQAPEATPAAAPSGPQVPPLRPSGPQVPHSTVPSGPQVPHSSAPSDAQVPHSAIPREHQNPPPQSLSGPQVAPATPSAEHASFPPRRAFEGPTPPSTVPQSEPVSSAPAHSGDQAPYRPAPSGPATPPAESSPGHHQEDRLRPEAPEHQTPVQEGAPPGQHTTEEPDASGAAQPPGFEDTDHAHLNESAGARPRARVLPTPEERELHGATPEEVPNGTADLMMARLRGEEISPLRAWSRLEGWRGDAECSYLPVEKRKQKEKEHEGWESLDATPNGLPRWRRQMHIAVAVCGTLLITLVTSSFAATNTSGPLIAAAEISGSEESGGSGDSGAEEQTTTGAEPVEPSSPPEVEEPTEITMEDTLSAVTLTWTDNSGGTADYFVLGSIQDQEPETLARTGPGAETAQVDTPNNSAEYCYTVIAVEGSASPADEVCTTRAADRAEAEREAEEAEREAEEEEEEADDDDDSSGSGSSGSDSEDSGGSDSGSGGSGSSGSSGD